MRYFNHDYRYFTNSNVPDGFFDLVILDPPYGKTNLHWDHPFDVHSTMKEMLRIVKTTGVLLIFGQNPEISKYILEGGDVFKYDLTWIKSRKNGYVNCNRMPLKQTEQIAVFSNGYINERYGDKMTYNPQFIRPCFQTKKQYDLKRKSASGYAKTEDNIFISSHKEYPTDVIEVSSIGKHDHPCKKPVELYEYLILTYSNLGDKVFDPCFGSGSSLVAGNGLNRKMFGCEKEKEYYDIAMSKLNNNLYDKMYIL